MSDRLAEAKAAIAHHRSSTMVETPKSLFDAIEERDTAIASTADTWRGQVLDELDQALAEVARKLETFSVDDLRDALPESLTAGVDLKVLGAVLRRAAQRGAITAVGYTASRRRHAAPVRVWKSQTESLNPEGN
jgi:hypothetical protein